MEERLQQLEEKIKLLENTATISFEVESAFKDRLKINTFLKSSDMPTGFLNAPLAAVTAPTGGLTIDSESRTAIGDLISRLQNLGLIN
jgi:hypothetical protein